MSVDAFKEAFEDYVVQANDPGSLARINEPQAHIALWKRPLPMELAIWLNALSTEQLPQERFIVAPKDCKDILQEIWQDYGHSGNIALQIASDMARCQ
jgi:hypothetical protein